jgi:DNA-binding NarL/FixJ family response regulator
MSAALRLMVVDDERLICEALAGLLNAQPDFTVVGLAADGSRVPELADRVEPDLVLMDVRMPDVDGVEAAGRLLARRPCTKVVMLTTFDVDRYVYAALRAGASGFLLKDVSAATLVSAVRTVAAGDAVLSPSATTRLIAAVARAVPEPLAGPPAVAALTGRERQVLAMVGRGLNNAEIGRELGIGYETVKSHVRAMMLKLNLRDRVQAVIVAYESGLLRPPPPPRG